MIFGSKLPLSMESVTPALVPQLSWYDVPVVLVDAIAEDGMCVAAAF